MNMREQAQTLTAVSNKVGIGTWECDTLEPKISSASV